MADFSLTKLGKLGRMWSVVFVANMAGTLIAALFCTYTPVLTPELRLTMLDISHHAVESGAFELLFRGVTAGFLIAAMVWLIPGADTAQFHVVTLMTYLIAVGGFAHIVAGSMEAFMLVVNRLLGVGSMIANFMVPVLLGNFFGGTVLFAVIPYAQVMQEI
jgi:formate/nitrite transporter FocA (FNT family)